MDVSSVYTFRIAAVSSTADGKPVYWGTLSPQDVPQNCVSGASEDKLSPPCEHRSIEHYSSTNSSGLSWLQACYDGLSKGFKKVVSMVFLGVISEHLVQNHQSYISSVRKVFVHVWSKVLDWIVEHL